METHAEWAEANHAYLAARVRRIHALLEHHGTDGSVADDPRLLLPPDPVGVAPPALRTLAERAGLDGFEEDVLVLAAAMELDSTTAARCAAAQANTAMDYPTLSLALAALPGAHWEALADAGALLRHGLVELAPGQGTMVARLSTPRRVWQHLLGLRGPDREVLRWARPLRGSTAPRPPSLTSAARALADGLQAPWRGERAPVFQLAGSSRRDRLRVATDALEETGVPGFVLPVEALPEDLESQARLRAVWAREVVLASAVIVLDGVPPQHGDPRARVAHQLLDLEGGVVIQSVDARRDVGPREVVCIDVLPLSPAEQRAAWSEALAESPSLCPRNAEGLPDPVALGDIARSLAAVFLLDSGGIDAALAEGALAAPDPTDASAVLLALSEACRAAARPRLGGLATRVRSTASWDELVVPPPVRERLRSLTASVTARARVLDDWGLGRGGAQGRGVTALFSGTSGVGKTMAAGVIASELQMDLWRVDLATVVNKYVGETEKRLRGIFDAAEGGGAVLLFDEADALFGKRTQVRDAQDRYANITVSYLLQRIESFGGVTILTTNLRESVDAAFLRRFRFVIEFPPPDQAARVELWRRAFPAQTPTRGLVPERLAQLPASGAVIRSIVLRASLAAALEAHDDPAVEMRHLLEAAKAEYRKARQPLTDREVAGWIDG